MAIGGPLHDRGQIFCTWVVRYSVYLCFEKLANILWKNLHLIDHIIDHDALMVKVVNRSRSIQVHGVS